MYKIMKTLFVMFVTLLLTNGGVRSVQREIPKIGIIGGGIGGTSCAFFLKSLFGESGVEIDLFEAEKVGGRLSSVNFSGSAYEEGGSIIHPRNKYMVDFLEFFGLKKKETADTYFGLYNGEDFVFSESSWRIITLYNFIRRYGFDFWKLRSHIEDMLTKFDRIYKLQSAGNTYTTVGSMLAAMDPKFPDYLRMTTKVGFEKEGLSKLLIDEIIQATIRVNYGQDLSVHKMVGSVSLAGVSGSVWSVNGGNVQIPERLLKESEANFFNLVVTTVKKTESGQIEIKTRRRSDEEENARLYDIVIIATPQTSDSKYRIEFEDFEQEIKFSGRYHKTVCTLVDGNLSQNFCKKNPIVDEIFSTNTNVPFNSVGRIFPVDYSPSKCKTSNVWKIFTQNKMSDALMSDLFRIVRRKHVKEWLAYPHYDDFLRNDTFVLAPNLYHINAIEWAASAMEMSVIGAKNVALLAHKHFTSEESCVAEVKVVDSKNQGGSVSMALSNCLAVESVEKFCGLIKSTGRYLHIN